MLRPSLRLAGAGLLFIVSVAVVSSNGRAQLKQPPAKDAPKTEEVKFTEAVTLPRNPESKRLIQAAQDYVKTQDWRIASECLQSLLETPEDSFIEVPRKNDRGQDMTIRVSVRSEANRIIGELPADALESYRVQYGQVAAERLKEALETADPVRLAEISQRYFNTKSGQDATSLLGTYHLDRGQYLMASLCFERLINRTDAEKLPSKVWFRAALAYRRAGNTAAADKYYARFADQYGREPPAGKSRPTLDQHRAEFVRDVGGDQIVTTTDWPVFRGNAARTAQCRGGTAYLEPRWALSLVRPEEPLDAGDLPAVQWIEQHLDQATQLLRDKPVLPAFFPIAANGKLFVRAYDGVAAYALNDRVVPDKKAGDLLWRSTTTNSLFKTIRDDYHGKRTKLQEWYNNYYLANNVGPIGVLFENSVLGAISHDGQRVYFIDDLAVPPHPTMTRGSAFMGAPVAYGPFHEDVQCNRLCAANIGDGKTCWDALGGRGPITAGPSAELPRDARRDMNAATELQDTFFLGPPLPLGGKLYLLTEKQSELRLVCLDPNKQVPSALNANNNVPEIVWVQSLGTANEKLPLDGQRRMQATHLAYGDGILVCPTNAGAVIGVDLLSHSLVWAFSYRKVQQQAAPEDQVMFRPRRIGGLTGGNPTLGERWRPSAPCVVKGKVIFTAPDSGDLHCLSLRDGQPLWSAKRDDADLYLAGAFDDRAVIVAKNHVRAVSLEAGKEIWKCAGTGLPCGQGVAADGTYYLPLASSIDPKTSDKGPEICAIDLKSGEIIGRSKSRKEMPGNLLFVDNELIAQTVRTISSYPLLKVKQEEINVALAKNPDDPTGLTERGELHLYNGAVREAVADLRRGLANQPPAEVRTKARQKLHEAFTLLMKDDFAGADKYVAEYAELCQVDVPANGDPESKQRLAAERIRRQAVYLELLGRGREKQGRLLDAFVAYEQYGELSGNKELVDSVDEPNTKSRPDIWSRGRIQALMASANDNDRKLLDAEIKKRWDSVRTAGLDGLRRFVTLYGTISAAGESARLELAERLMSTGDADDLTEAERLLAAFCFSSRQRRNDPLAAGKATDLMVRVCIRRGRFENAVGFARQLAAEFPDVPVRDGVTGRQFLAEFMTDKRFLPYLTSPTSIWPGPLTANPQHGNFNNRDGSMTLQPQGDLLPFFDRHRLVLDIRQDGGPGLWTMRLVDRATGDERWRVPNLPSNNLANTGQFAVPAIHACGHLLVMQFNEWVVAQDLNERKELWRFNLLGKDARSPADQNPMRAFDPQFNRLVEASSDERKAAIGQICVVESSHVIVQGRDGLTAIDPMRRGPSRLWINSDVSAKASVFGDDQHVFVFDRDAPANRPNKCQAFRAQDGASVTCADFAEFFKKKLRIVGGKILVADGSNRALRLIDALTREEVWRKDFPADSVVIRTGAEKLTGVVTPAGELTLINLVDGKMLLKCSLGEDYAQKLQEATLLVDREMYYLALLRKPESGLTWNSPAAPWVQNVPFNGPLIGINRKTGTVQWACPWVPHQTLLTDQLADLPILLCASSFSKRAANGAAERQGVQIDAVDKATGKLFFAKEFAPSAQFHALVAHPGTGKIEFVRQDLKIVFSSAESSAANAGATPSSNPNLPARAASPPPEPIVESPGPGGHDK